MRLINSKIILGEGQEGGPRGEGYAVGFPSLDQLEISLEDDKGNVFVITYDTFNLLKHSIEPRPFKPSSVCQTKFVDYVDNIL